MQETSNQPLNFLLRIPQVTRIEEFKAIRVSTFEAHAEVMEKIGRVSIAKFGKPPLKAKIDQLREQIRAGIPTFLILSIKTSKKFVGYQGALTAIHLGQPTSEIRNMCPDYYRHLGYAAGVWFTVRKKFVPCDLGAFTLPNGKSCLDVIRTSRTPSLFVIRV